MKKMIILIFAMVFMTLLVTSAQTFPRPASQRPNFPQQADLKANLKAEIQAGLDTEPDCEPTADMDVEEFQLQRNDLKGQVVELTFDRVVSLKQAGKEGYVAMVTYESPRLAQGLSLMIPADGLDFFEELSKINYPRKSSVYIEVLTPSTVKALGTRYSKNKDLGERYSW